MKLALATTLVSLALLATTMLETGVQAQEVLAPRPRRMVRRTSVLGLVEERLHDLVEKLDELSLSMSMSSSTTDNEKLVAAELNLPSITAGSSSNYTATELKQFQERFEKTSLGAVILAGMAATASLSSSGTADAAAGGAGGGSSTTHKSAKTGVCADRLEMVQDKLEELYLVEVSAQAITAACSFAHEIDSPLNAGYFPNLSCPTKAVPFMSDLILFEGDFLTNDFLYEEFYSSLGRALWLHHKYCECHQGYKLGCAAKIPYPEESSGSALRSLVSAFLTDGEFGLGSNVQPGDNPKKWQDYCKFAAVWNGDISYERYDDIGLNPEVKECGCFFVGSARKNMAGCPGVDLYAHFQD